MDSFMHGFVDELVKVAIGAMIPPPLKEGFSSSMNKQVGEFDTAKALQGSLKPGRPMMTAGAPPPKTTPDSMGSYLGK